MARRRLMEKHEDTYLYANIMGVFKMLRKLNIKSILKMFILL